jgi:hypothetical protein
MNHWKLDPKVGAQGFINVPALKERLVGVSENADLLYCPVV